MYEPSHLSLRKLYFDQLIRASTSITHLFPHKAMVSPWRHFSALFIDGMHGNIAKMLVHQLPWWQECHAEFEQVNLDRKITSCPMRHLCSQGSQVKPFKPKILSKKSPIPDGMDWHLGPFDATGTLYYRCYAIGKGAHSRFVPHWSNNCLPPPK